MQNEHITATVITDCKTDDMFACKHIIRTYLKVRFVVSDVKDIEGASASLKRLCEEVQANDVSFHEGDRRQTAHKHEEVFLSVTSFFGDTDNITFEQLPLDEIEFSHVYWLAPFTDILRFKEALVVYGSMGHNINSSKLSLKDMNQFKNFVTMNNLESFPKGKEGGRFTVAQTRELAGNSPILNMFIPFAEKNSIEFMAKQLTKYGNGSLGYVPHSSPLSYEELIKRIWDNPNSLIPYVNEIFKSVTGNDPNIDSDNCLVNTTDGYFDRVLDQIYNQVQIELTDLQHVVAYNMKSATRVRGDFVLVVQENGVEQLRFKDSVEGKVECVKGLTRESMWKACQEQFLERSKTTTDENTDGVVCKKQRTDKDDNLDQLDQATQLLA